MLLSDVLHSCVSGFLRVSEGLCSCLRVTLVSEGLCLSLMVSPLVSGFVLVSEGFVWAGRLKG